MISIRRVFSVSSFFSFSFVILSNNYPYWHPGGIGIVLLFIRTLLSNNLEEFINVNSIFFYVKLWKTIELDISKIFLLVWGSNLT
jgi:hypothetical protein